MPKILQWTVAYGRGFARRQAIFESRISALECAADNADADWGSVVHEPDGTGYAVVRLSPHVEVLTQRHVAGGI